MSTNLNWIKNSALFMSSWIIAIVAAEIIFRIFNIGYGNSPSNRSEIYHHVHPANYSFLMYDPYGEYGGFHLHYDEIGYRVSDPSFSNFQSEDAPNAIVFMGDSFTESKQVPFEESFPAILGDKLKVPVLNLGVSSYSPVIYQLQVNNQVQSAEASLVVLQIYSNDFDGDSKYLKHAEYAENTLVGINGGESNFMTSFVRWSYLARFIRKSQLLLQYMLSSETHDNEGESIARNDPFVIEQTVSQGDLLQTSDILVEIKQELERTNKQLVIFMIPSKTLSRKMICCEDDEIYGRFMEQMRLRNIPTLDVSSYFENSSNQKDLFFETDIHLTAAGHAVLAEGLLIELKKAGLVKPH